ncbi:coiled-coil domain-containing protein 7-like [Liolophura sinensis]|uniref:coiled-coil domain-containing protein 7-like n=1 Tax=Liolophura sinensis TaxID=3198878 RepID=UPI003158159F
MNTFVTHPSIRVKGTEANFTPSQCTDPACTYKAPHMHCPFCMKTDSYVDPVILKMHYRVKHVDKGVDFAGLKILRCCDRCEIVGAIKGEKTFKGAHWHCYKCRNGFNRRDEAVKHYKTHFRNPETTFQIQISQVEESLRGQTEVTSGGNLISDQGQDVTIHPALTEAVMSSSALANGVGRRSSTSTNGKGDREVQVPVAANETVGSTEGQTIMIIHEADMETTQTIDNSYTVIPGEDYSDDNSAVDSVLEELAVSQDQDIQKKYRQLQQQCRQLESEKSELKAELQELRTKLKTQTEMLSKCQRREQDLLQQLSVPLDKATEDLLKQLEKNHKELLHQQLGALRRSYLNQQSKEQQTITIPSAALQSAVLGAESGSISITIQRNDMAGDGLGETHGTTLAVQQYPDHVQDSPGEFEPSESCKVISTADGSVVGLFSVTQQSQLSVAQQSQLSVAAPFDASCASSDSQAVTLTTSAADTYDTGLTTVIDSSDLTFTTVPSMQVEQASPDIRSSESHEQTSAEDPPAKRSKHDSRS